MLSIFCLGALSLILGYAALNHGEGSPVGGNLSLVVLGVAGALASISAPRSQPRSRIERFALWSALLLPVYVAVQLIPFPLGVVRVLSPARAEIADALGPVLPAPQFAALVFRLLSQPLVFAPDVSQSPKPALHA